MAAASVAELKALTPLSSVHEEDINDSVDQEQLERMLVDVQQQLVNVESHLNWLLQRPDEDSESSEAAPVSILASQRRRQRKELKEQRRSLTHLSNCVLARVGTMAGHDQSAMPTILSRRTKRHVAGAIAYSHSKTDSGLKANNRGGNVVLNTGNRPSQILERQRAEKADTLLGALGRYKAHMKAVKSLELNMRLRQQGELLRSLKRRHEKKIAAEEETRREKKKERIRALEPLVPAGMSIPSGIPWSETQKRVVANERRLRRLKESSKARYVEFSVDLEESRLVELIERRQGRDERLNALRLSTRSASAADRKSESNDGIETPPSLNDDISFDGVLDVGLDVVKGRIPISAGHDSTFTGLSNTMTLSDERRDSDSRATSERTMKLMELPFLPSLDIDIGHVTEKHVAEKVLHEKRKEERLLRREHAKKKMQTMYEAAQNNKMKAQNMIASGGIAIDFNNCTDSDDSIGYLEKSSKKPQSAGLILANINGIEATLAGEIRRIQCATPLNMRGESKTPLARGTSSVAGNSTRSDTNEPYNYLLGNNEIVTSTVYKRMASISMPSGLTCSPKSLQRIALNVDNVVLDVLNQVRSTEDTEMTGKRIASARIRRARFSSDVVDTKKSKESIRPKSTAVSSRLRRCISPNAPLSIESSDNNQNENITNESTVKPEPLAILATGQTTAAPMVVPLSLHDTLNTDVSFDTRIVHSRVPQKVWFVPK